MIRATPPPGPGMQSLPSIPTTFTPPIAARAMTVTRHGRTAPLQLEIGQPVQDVETVIGTDWRCPVRLRQGDTTTLHNACGVDSFQALQLAMETVRIQLEALAGEEGVSLQFLDCPYDVRTQLPDAPYLRAATSAGPPDE